jgi:hypothetical protein
MLDIRITQAVLVFAILELVAGIDKEYIVTLFLLIEDGDSSRNARAIEEVRWQTDNGFEKVLLDSLQANLTLRFGENKKS